MILLHCTRVGLLSKCSYSVLTMYLTHSYNEIHPGGIMTASRLLIHNITDEQLVISLLQPSNGVQHCADPSSGMHRLAGTCPV